jgi:hypothetical protein
MIPKSRYRFSEKIMTHQDCADAAIPARDSRACLLHAADGVADDAGGSFPGNITWAFSPESERRLRHWPDIVVRPGGLKFEESGQVPLQSELRTAA